MITHYVIYYNPLDYPGKYAIRKWYISRENDTTVMFYDKNAIICETLEEARKHIPEETYRIPRYEEDDKAICEVWI